MVKLLIAPCNRLCMPGISLTHPGLNPYLQMKYAKSITQFVKIMSHTPSDFK